jgi:mannose-6-phosphate isomerase-like protein (cupin superfamily)
VAKTTEKQETSVAKPEEAPRAHAIMQSTAERTRWGDEVAGFVSDWVYLRTPQLLSIVFTMAPGQSFKASGDWMPLYDAQVCEYVLAGEYTLHNPTTGEIRVVTAGQSVAFGAMSWHYGYNFADTELRVIEWLAFSSDPIKPNSRTTTPGREFGVDPDLVGRSHERATAGSRHVDHVTDENALRVILGSSRQVRASILTSTPMLTVAAVEIPGAHRTDLFCHGADAFIFTEHGRVNAYVPEQNVWAELNDDDAFVVPAGVSYQLLNQSDRRSRILLAITGASLEAPA